MTGVRSGRSLLLWVAGTTLILLAASRWAGHPRDDAPGAAPQEDEPAATAPSTPPPSARAGDVSAELSFYQALGKPKPADETRFDAGVAAPPRAADTAGTFVVQALATRDGAVARRLRSRLAAGGFPATLHEDRSGAAAVFRVRAGRYADRAAAEAAARRLRRDFGVTPWVLRDDG